MNKFSKSNFFFFIIKLKIIIFNYNVYIRYLNSNIENIFDTHIFDVAII